MNISYFIIPVLVILVMIIAYIKKVNAYDSFLEGAKEGMGLPRRK